jgi:hypothetical protein
MLPEPITPELIDRMCDQVGFLRDTDPAAYRRIFADRIPLDAQPSEAYSDRQLEVIRSAMRRTLEEMARAAATLH